MERLVTRILLTALAMSIDSASVAPSTMAQELNPQPISQSFDSEGPPLFRGGDPGIVVMCLGENHPTTIYFDHENILFNGVIAGPSDADFAIVMGNPELGQSILVDAGHDREVGTEITVDGDINSYVRDGVEIQFFPPGVGGYYIPGRIASHTRVDASYISFRDAQRVLPSACQHVTTWNSGIFY